MYYDLMKINSRKKLKKNLKGNNSTPKDGSQAKGRKTAQRVNCIMIF